MEGSGRGEVEQTHGRAHQRRRHSLHRNLRSHVCHHTQCGIIDVGPASRQAGGAAVHGGGACHKEGQAGEERRGRAHGGGGRGGRGGARCRRGSARKPAAGGIAWGSLGGGSGRGGGCQRAATSASGRFEVVAEFRHALGTGAGTGPLAATTRALRSHRDVACWVPATGGQPRHSAAGSEGVLPTSVEGGSPVCLVPQETR